MSNTQVNNPLDATASPALRIDVQSHLEDEAVPLPAEAIAEVYRAVAVTLQVRGFHAAEIEIAIVDDPTIHRLNQRHLRHDWETDVISFPYQCRDGSLEGELIVSWDTAARESKNTGWPALTELVLYCIHGTLHLTGLDDHEPAEREQMRQFERQVLLQLKLPGVEKYDVDAACSSPDPSSEQSNS